MFVCFFKIPRTPLPVFIFVKLATKPNKSRTHVELPLTLCHVEEDQQSKLTLQQCCFLPSHRLISPFGSRLHMLHVTQRAIPQ